MTDLSEEKTEIKEPRDGEKCPAENCSPTNTCSIDRNRDINPDASRNDVAMQGTANENRNGNNYNNNYNNGYNGNGYNNNYNNGYNGNCYNNNYNNGYNGNCYNNNYNNGYNGNGYNNNYNNGYNGNGYNNNYNNGYNNNYNNSYNSNGYNNNFRDNNNVRQGCCYPPQRPVNQNNNCSSSPTIGIIGLVLSAVGSCLACLAFFFLIIGAFGIASQLDLIAFVVCIVGFVLSSSARTKATKNVTTCGIVFGAIGMGISGLILMYFLVIGFCSLLILVAFLMSGF